MGREQWWRSATATTTAALLLTGCNGGTVVRPCRDATQAAGVACAADPQSKACLDLKKVADAACASPSPSPPTQTPVPESPPPTAPPPTAPPASPTPPPPVTTGCVLAGEPSLGVARPVNSLGVVVNAAMAALRPDCSPGGECLLGDMPLQQWQAKVEAELRKRGVCAGQHSPSTDEIAVAMQASDDWQGFKVGAGDDSLGPVPPGQPRRTVVWSPGGFRGAWKPPSWAATPTPGPIVTPPVATPTPEQPVPTATPPPPPPPGPGDGCLQPQPPPLHHFNIRAWNTNCATLDVTPQVNDPSYCRAIGLPGRGMCPVRAEDAPDRMACERRVIGGLPLYRVVSGAGCEVWPCGVAGNCRCAGRENSNPLQAIVIGKRCTVQVCDAAGARCSNLTLP